MCMTDNAEDKKETRDHLKKYRFTQTELDQIEVVLKKTGWTLTDFFRTALQSEIQKHYFFVPTFAQLQGRYVKRHKPPEVKVKTIKRYIDTDPNLLIEHGRIGNNLNQTAKALNIIYKDPNAISKFSFLECFHALSQMQNDLHHFLGELPKIERSPEAVNRARERALKKRSGEDVH